MSVGCACADGTGLLCKASCRSEMNEKAYLCDLMEYEISEIEVNDGTLTLDVGCFEIVTVKLK